MKEITEGVCSAEDFAKGLKPKKIKEKVPTRRRGYYFRDEKNYPSVSTVSKCIGDPTGLIHWNVSQGAEALIAEVLKNPEMFDKAEKFLRKNGNEAYTTPALLGWAREIAHAGSSAELRRAGDFGTQAHKLIENHILQNSNELDAMPGALQALETYKTFEADIEPKYLYLEEEVVNTEAKYGGRLDCIVGLEKDCLSRLNPYLKKNSDEPCAGKIIVDFKTGSFMKDSHARQLGAYAIAMQIDKGVGIAGGMVIHIERDNPDDMSIHFYDRVSLDKGYKAFMACHRAWELNLAPQWYQKESV